MILEIFSNLIDSMILFNNYDNNVASEKGYEWKEKHLIDFWL